MELFELAHRCGHPRPRHLLARRGRQVAPAPLHSPLPVACLLACLARRNRPDDLPAGHGLRSHGADPARREAWIPEHRRLFDRSLLEKIVLVGFVCVLFAKVIPGVDRTSVQIFVGAAVLIVIDSLLGLRTARRSGGASSIAWSFVWLAVANEAIVALGRLTRGDEQLALGNTIFFVGLLTLIVTLYDRYEPYRGVRLEESPQGAWV